MKIKHILKLKKKDSIAAPFSDRILRYGQGFNAGQAELGEREIEVDVEKIISILSNPKHWCPSKATQWRRVASAIASNLDSVLREKV